MQQSEKIKKKKRKQRSHKDVFYTLPFVLILSLLFLGASEAAIPDRYYPDSVNVSENSASNENAENASAEAGGVSAETDGDYTAKVFGVIPAKTVKTGIPKDLTLVPCGDVFGVKFFTKGVVITGISEVESREGIISPAAKAGLKTGDVILSLDGHEINTVEEMTDYVSDSGGDEIEIEFVRDDKNYKARLLPIKSASDSKYKAGLWVRDSTAGIGTCTFYNPQDGSFAALGHGIYDADAELLMPLLRGAVVDIELEDIIKGRDGHPGELKGSFSSEKTGSLIGNTACGIYGILNEAPELICNTMPVAESGEVKEGKATILSNVDGKGISEYDIEIIKIYSGSEQTKNFVIEVCDDELLAKTGGIVRGMSGSPIIQNGKLVGAVTHVLVNDPKRGYGIFIENMLSVMPEILYPEKSPHSVLSK